MNVIEEMKEIERLIKRDPHSGEWGEEAEQMLHSLCIVIGEHIRYGQIMEIIHSICQNLPNSLALQLAEICGFDLEEIEGELGVEGFNNWYQKTYDKTVEEASK